MGTPMNLKRAALAFAVLAILYGVAAQIGAQYLPHRVWWIAHHVDDVELLPTYGSLADETAFLIRSGVLPRGVVVSTGRVLAGLLLGVVIGVAAGLSMAWARHVDDVLSPWVTLVRYTPALALLPLYVLWFGLGETSKVLLVATAVSPVMLLGAYQGVRAIPHVYLDAATLLGASGGVILRRVVLPGALPTIVASFRIALGLAWVTIVAAELVAPTIPSLGYLLAVAAAFPRVPTIVVGIATIGGLVLLSDAVTLSVYRVATQWMPRRVED
jgi:ABC-type nitrate/sulfonate/bicarbonate transport system permease component